MDAQDRQQAARGTVKIWAGLPMERTDETNYVQGHIRVGFRHSRFRQEKSSRNSEWAHAGLGRVNNGDNRYNTTSAKKHMDAGKSMEDNVILSQWRSDPLLNQMATSVNRLELQSTNLMQSKGCDPYKPMLNDQSPKRSSSNKHSNRMRKKQLTSAQYYSTLHDPLKPTQTPSLAPRSLTKPILANPSVPTLLNDDQPWEETVENYAIFSPKAQASFV
ncbi:unnamed protein product [Calicophoron daubneyi]|uniref:Uncharacterized protein n=1 Tax=Calicophoron daubneyi TaxID=300641 RepID=A0AAV2SZ31_CALDB